MTEEKNSERLLSQRNALRKPAFVVKESHFKAGVKESWRRPRGKHSPVRQCHKGRLRMPNPGYGAPKEVHGFTRDGRKPVSVQRIKDLEQVNINTDAVVIGSNVGLRKRLLLLKACNEANLVVVGVADLKKELMSRDRQFANSKKITSARRKAVQNKAKSSPKEKDTKKETKETKKDAKSETTNVKKDAEVKPEAVSE